MTRGRYREDGRSNSGLQSSEFVYAPMVRDIIENINTEKLKYNDKLPTEAQLKQRYGISITSVRRGIDCLVKEGIIERRQGSGTYVRKVIDNRHRQIKRDTVALISILKLEIYHPYFSEIFKGIRSGLTDAGWQIYEYQGTFNSSATQQEIVLQHIDSNRVSLELQRHPEFAGAIIGASIVESLPVANRKIPLVAMDRTACCPYVDYDLAAELVRAVESVIARKAGTIYVYSGIDKQELIARLKERKLYLPDRFRYIFHHSQAGNLPSEIAGNAFQSTLNVFEQYPDIDGVVVGSDYEAQGVLDGLYRLNRKRPDNFSMASIVNRESKLMSYGFPFTRFVVDGFKKGKALAMMLDHHIHNPASAPKRIILSTDMEEY